MTTKPHPDQQPLFDPGDPVMKRQMPKPRRKLGSPGPSGIEEEKRDHALDLLRRRRSALVAIGRDVAIEIARQRGRVTSVEVFAQMRAYGYDEEMDNCDPRWMGAVFNESIWEREGWEQTGSHKRPVAIWRLRDRNNIPVSPREKVYRVISDARERGATVSEIVSATAMSGSRVRSILKDLQALERISIATVTRSKRSKNAYFLPEHDPEIV